MHIFNQVNISEEPRIPSLRLQIVPSTEDKKWIAGSPEVKMQFVELIKHWKTTNHMSGRGATVKTSQHLSLIFSW